MSVYEIETGIIIDETEGLLDGINRYSTFELQSLDTVFTFIREEYHTKFYVDRKMSVSMREDKDTIYLWLDTGIRTENDDPVFISLLKNEERYIGHYIGTVNVLSRAVRDFSPWNTQDIKNNKGKMKQKYLSRIKKREIAYIESENDYILKKINSNRSINSMSDVFNWLEWDTNTEEEVQITEAKSELKIVEFPVPDARDFSGTKIVLDLEFTPVDEDQKEMHRLSKFEVIQFGAVKLNSKNEIIARYDSLVKPRYSKCIDPKVVKLTGITDEMVSEAPDFINVVQGFLAWIGGTQTVMSWSMEDLRVLRNESIQKGLIDGRLDILFDNWIDLQKMFGDKIGVEKQIALENAVAGLDMEFEGKKHTALDDAINTANIFQIMQNESDFKDRYKEVIDLFKPSKELTFSLGSMFGDLMSQLANA